MHRRQGFTLTELLIAITIIALLIAILLPTLHSARSRAQKTACLSQLQQIGDACLNYSILNNGWYPDSAPNEGGDVDCSNQQLILTNTDLYTLYRYETSPKRDYYLGPGLLVLDHFISDPRILYCPSWTAPDVQYGAADGWPANLAVPLPIPRGATEYDMSYNYRSSFGEDLTSIPTNGEVNGSLTPVMEWGRPARSGRSYCQLITATSTGGTLDSSKIAIASDGFAVVASLGTTPGVSLGHSNGYNVLYLDGHVAWYLDAHGEIATLAQTGAGYSKNSKKWNDYELNIWNALMPQ